jgi:hypothetical protein
MPPSCCVDANYVDFMIIYQSTAGLHGSPTTPPRRGGQSYKWNTLPETGHAPHQPAFSGSQ